MPVLEAPAATTARTTVDQRDIDYILSGFQDKEPYKVNGKFEAASNPYYILKRLFDAAEIKAVNLQSDVEAKTGIFIGADKYANMPRNNSIVVADGNKKTSQKLPSPDLKKSKALIAAIADNIFHEGYGAQANALKAKFKEHYTGKVVEALSVPPIGPQRR